MCLGAAGGGQRLAAGRERERERACTYGDVHVSFWEQVLADTHGEQESTACGWKRMAVQKSFGTRLGIESQRHRRVERFALHMPGTNTSVWVRWEPETTSISPMNLPKCMILDIRTYRFKCCRVCTESKVSTGLRKLQHALLTQGLTWSQAVLLPWNPGYVWSTDCLQQHSHRSGKP